MAEQTPSVNCFGYWRSEYRPPEQHTMSQGDHAPNPDGVIPTELSSSYQVLPRQATTSARPLAAIGDSISA